MFRMACIAASAALWFSADIPPVSSVQTPVAIRTQVLSDQNVSVLPDLSTATSGASSSTASSSSASSSTDPSTQPTVDQPDAKPAGPLQEQSRMQILRF